MNADVKQHAALERPATWSELHWSDIKADLAEDLQRERERLAQRRQHQRKAAAVTARRGRLYAGAHSTYWWLLSAVFIVWIVR